MRKQNTSKTRRGSNEILEENEITEQQRNYLKHN